jgi:DNA-binding CsgD family transcriptional regulator
MIPIHLQYTTKSNSYPNLRKIITSQDALFLLELLNKLNMNCNIVSFIEVLKDLKKIVPYEKSVSVIANINTDGRILSYKIVNISYPDSWLEIYQEKKYEIIDPVMQNNFCSYELFYWKGLKRLKNGNDNFWTLAGDFGLIQGCTYGLPDRLKTAGSLFSFTGVSLQSPRNEAILRIIIPQLDLKLREIFAKQPQPDTRLTHREIEVLKWVKEGKSNWDIASILKISERTVKYHISSILKKLDVVNRSQAVAVAITENLILL